MEIEEEKSHLLSEEMKWRIVHYKKDGLGDRATARVVGEEYNRPSLSHQEVKKFGKNTKKLEVSKIFGMRMDVHQL